MGARAPGARVNGGHGGGSLGHAARLATVEGAGGAVHRAAGRGDRDAQEADVRAVRVQGGAPAGHHRRRQGPAFVEEADLPALRDPGGPAANGSPLPREGFPSYVERRVFPGVAELLRGHRGRARGPARAKGPRPGRWLPAGVGREAAGADRPRRPGRPAGCRPGTDPAQLAFELSVAILAGASIVAVLHDDDAPSSTMPARAVTARLGGA